jgi:hypothetical protein
MANINEMIPSKYLKQSDFNESGFIVTVLKVMKENVARDDEPPEEKWILFFKEFAKGMVLNSTNIHMCAKACGSDDTDNWVDKEIIVYVDPNVGFAGKVTGGLRIKRHIEQKAPTAPKSAPRTAPPSDDGRFDDMPNDDPDRPF